MDELCGSPFWDANITWNTENPDFTECFKNTALIWLPCFYLWIFSPLEYYFLRKSKAREIPFNKYNIIKLFFIVLLIMQILIEAINDEVYDAEKPPIFIHTSICKFLTFNLFFMLTWANIKMGVRSSGVLFIYSFLLMICSLPQIRTIALINNPLDNSVKIFQFFYGIFHILPPFMVFLLNCFADSRPKYWLCEEPDNSDPSQEASFLSKLYLHWFNYFVWQNYKKPFENILWNIQEDEKTTYLSSKFEKYWYPSGSSDQSEEKMEELKELNEFRENPTPQPTNHSLMRPLFKMLWLDVLSCMFWKIMEMFSVLAYPLTFSVFLTFMVDNEPAWKGYLCSFLFLFNGLLQAAILNEMYVKVITIQAKIRSVLMSVIYKKALRISSGVRKQYTSGDIINLLSIDTERISGSFKPIMNSWTSPIQMALSCYFIWNILGFSVLSSFVVVIVLLPIINFLIKKMKILQTVEMKNKDKRGKFIQELLAGIKVLKMYAWEPFFQKEVSRLRKKEMRIIRKHSYLNALILFTFTCIPFLMSFATFATYVLSSVYHTLDVRKAFVTISFFNALRNPLQALPDAISNLTQAVVSIKRINQFLNLEELDPEVVLHENTEEALIIENGSFSWNGDSSTPTLHNLNVKIQQGSIISIVGSVGAGKSSLISAFLGEMYKIQGYVNTKGKIAYVSQQAWILNTTVKENITLGKPVNESLYEKVLEACALKTDLATMPDYDLTEIGEKGINLSGGQKQRVSLARALYHDAEIYFLDDPLSSVDFHIADHIFQNALSSNGMLKGKTRLLVTHTTAFLPQTDLIIVLKNGCISESGTYLSLVERNGDFAEFLRTYSNETRRENGNNAITIQEVKPNLHEVIQRDFKHKSIQNLKKLIGREHLETGEINRKVYAFYLSAVGVCFVGTSLTMYVLYQVLSILSNVWLLKWSTAENPSDTNATQSQTASNNYFYFEVYLALGVAEASAILIGNLILFSGLLKASSYFHDTLLTSILKWPTWLLDSTPVGRIINRLTTDIYILDGKIGPIIVNVIIFSSRLLSICIVIIYTTPICTLVIVPILIILCAVQKFHSSLAHQISRIESINKSPLYSCFVETISGLQSVRAYRYQNRSICRVSEKIDRCSAALMSNFICLRCLATKMDILGGCIGFFAAYFLVPERHNLDIGLIGFSMSYSIQMTRELTWLLLRSLEIENGIVAVERIKEFIEQSQEAPSYLPSDNKHLEWPKKGEIIVESYSLRYRQDLDLVLNDISFKIKSGEKIGVVGRTGAGKTSLILGLFRLIEPAGGKILIDDEDIGSIGLHLLRSRLTLIPQDPVLFLGTLRFNLDPTEACSDENLWKILEKAHLKNFVSNLRAGLQYNIDEGGGNISNGQKQLICLARALLRKTKVLILDEATASVDMETDELIQKTIRNEFAECTVLTIAHRLNTVQDYDRILVIDNGRVAEFDSPSNLINSGSSLFYKMARESGII